MSANNTTTATKQPKVFDQVWEQNRLQDFLYEIDRRQHSIKDYMADSDGIDFQAEKPNDAQIILPQGDRFGVNPLAHGQIASKFGIDKRYYDKCLAEEPELLAENVRTWFKHDRKRILLRTIDGNARAVLSNRYRILDNFDLLGQAVFPAIKEFAADFGSALTIQQSALTERRLYLKVTTDKVQGEVKQGDIVQAGFIVSNSEVGAGSWKVEQFLWRLTCLNGMVGSMSLRKFHMGGANDDEGTSEIYTDNTRNKMNDALISQTKDIVGACLNRDHFEEALDKMRTADGIKINTDPAKLIEVTGQTCNASGFGEGEQENIMSNFMEAGDMSAWGLTNAITAAAKDATTYDRRVEMERMGGKLIELNPADWLSMQKQASDN